MRLNYFIYYFLFFYTLCLAGLNRPGSGQHLNYIHVLFDWDQEPMAFSYQLQISSDNEFSNRLLNINEIKTIHIEQSLINWDQKYF